MKKETFYGKLYMSENSEEDNNRCNQFLTYMPTLSHKESLPSEKT